MSSAHYDVRITAGAERDLESIHDFIAANISPAGAASVLDRLLDAADSLATHPERGSHPQELLALGIREYRQTIVSPYRIIYRIIGDRVHITLIADGRRDMQSLLARRLLEA
jgi:toxin ParE1/3/4